MANGTDVLVAAETAVPDTFTAIGSQRNVTITENTAVIDESSKAAREFLGSAGRYTCDISLNALYVASDAGWALLKAAMQDGTTIKLQLSDGGTPTEEIDTVCTQLTEECPDQQERIVSATFRGISAWAAA